MFNAPDFQTLSVDTIPLLSAAELSTASCAALDTLRDGPGALEGSLELLEGDEADALYKTLWSIHMIPTVRHVPDRNPYAEEETGEVQEAFVGLLREAMARYRTTPVPDPDLTLAGKRKFKMSFEPKFRIHQKLRSGYEVFILGH